MVKHIIILLFLFSSSKIFGNTQYSLGLFTQHYNTENYISAKFKNCISKDCKLILNPIFNAEFNKQNLFIGINSIGNIMAGYRYNYNIINHKLININITAGGYYQDYSKYQDKKINMPSYYNITPVLGLDIYNENLGILIMPNLSIFYIKF